MQSLAIISDIGFNEHDIERFNINLLKKKFDLYLLDITNISNHYFDSSIKNLPHYFKFNKIEDLEFFLKEKKINIIIDFVSNYKSNFKLKLLRKIYNFKLIYWQNHLVHQVKKKFSEKLLNAIFTISDLKRIKGKIRYFLSRKKNKNFFYDIVIVCGNDGLNYSYIGKKTKVIKAHSYEYEQVLKKKYFLKVCKNEKKISIFLDQYLPYHSDAIKIKKFNPKTTAKNYYPALNNFFNAFEKKTGTEVIIAAHPKSNYEKMDHWNGRKFLKNQTLNLINDSSFVLAHQSTSISYAIILNKKIIFLTSNEYIKSYDNFTVHGYARYLGMPLFNIDRFREEQILKNINNLNYENYKNYINNYIKCDIRDNRDLWSTFTENIYA